MKLKAFCDGAISLVEALPEAGSDRAALRTPFFRPEHRSKRGKYECGIKAHIEHRGG
jgi:hypothetical protein